MRITDIRVLELRQADVADTNDSSQDAAIVCVDTDAGVRGIGEVDSAPSVVKAVVDAPRSHHIAAGLREILVGSDATDVAGAWRRMYEGTMFYGRAGIVMQAISGVELALWDIAGKAAGQPVYELLGGTRRPVRCYSSVLAPEPGDAGVVAEHVSAAGYEAVKIGWGAFREGFEAGKVGHEEKIVAAVRQALPDAVELMVDIGFYWQLPEAVTLARRLGDLGVRWIEEPFDPGDVASYRTLAASSPTAVAAGENETSLDGFGRLVDDGHVGVVQPDVTRCGGLSVAVQVADLARRRGIRCVPHVWSTGVNRAVATHFALIAGLDLVENCDADTDLNRALVHGDPELRNGHLMVSDAPGWGIELDDTVVQAMLVSGSR